LRVIKVHALGTVDLQQQGAGAGGGEVLEEELAGMHKIENVTDVVNLLPFHFR
jgi:hypothetical protein